MSGQRPEFLLEVRNLKTYFVTEDGGVKAVDGVDFYVNPGEVLGLVGELRCGKSVISLSIMRPVAFDHCSIQEPPFKEVSPEHWVACWQVE